MLYIIDYVTANRKWDVAVVRRGSDPNSLELCVLPLILDEVVVYQLKQKKFVKRIDATRIIDNNKKPYPKGSLVRKSLPENIRLEFNTESSNLCLYKDDVLIDILFIKNPNF